MDFMEEVESEREYDGYYYSLGEALSIVVLGSLCGLKNVSQIHQWAESERTREWLKEKFAIERIPCYYWLLSVLKMVKPESLNQCLSRWVRQILPEEREGLTLAVDGKTVRSTEGKKGYQRPLHIISAQLSELGVTLASKSVDGKSNEIPAVQELFPAKATICSASRRINLLLCRISGIMFRTRLCEAACLRKAFGRKTASESKRGRLLSRRILTGYRKRPNGIILPV